MSAKHTPMAVAMAKELCRHESAVCGVDADDNWKFYSEDFLARAEACLKACGAPELLEACINARDILATDRQSFVEYQQLRDSRTDDPIAHGLVAVEDDVWIDSVDAEALHDYDRAIEKIDSAVAKATGGAA